ncbi:recombinase family protein [Cellvibrio zantedeschiae]|nr:recombinase family protein [Cellvibrio zantedeschiae]
MGIMTVVGYARVSSHGQSLDIQLERLKSAGCARIYQEKASGKAGHLRPQFKACMDYIREGDRLVVTRLDRLARSVLDLAKISDRFTQEGIDLIVLDQHIDTSTPSGKLLFNMLAVIAEFENDLRRERQTEGIAKAKELNIKFGRPSSLSDSEEIELLNDKQAGMPMSQLLKKYKIGKATAYRIISRLSSDDKMPNQNINELEV